MSEYICEGCKQPLTDCGPIGYACLNKECTYERDQAIKWLKANKEREERAELARLKAKYEPEFQVESLDPDERSWYYDGDGTQRKKDERP